MNILNSAFAIPLTIVLCVAPAWSQAETPPIAAPVADESAVPIPVRGQMEIYLLVGQSNMVGHGPLKDSTSKPHPRVWMLGNDYKWKTATEPLFDPTNHVDVVTLEPNNGVGPGMAFALALAQDPKRIIGLLPSAKGGRPLQFFLKPEDFDPTDPAKMRASAYGSTLYRARQAQKMGRLAGVLFFQGEGDSNPGNSTSAGFGAKWGEAFSSWVTGLRDDLNQPDLPVVFAQLGTTGGKNTVLWDEVKASQARVKLPQVAMIKTEDLPRQDNAHFTTPSYEEIGRRFAAAMLRLQAPPAPEPAMSDTDYATPSGNVVRRNVAIGGEWIRWTADWPNPRTPGMVRVEANMVGEDPGFVAPERGDFRFKPHAPALKMGFEPIPFEQIGPQTDEYQLVK